MGLFRDCTSGIAKYILFLLNLLILVCAITLIVLAVLYRNKNAGLDLMSVSSYAIAVGVLIALISFFGCCGAIKESSCLLTTYAGILITLFIIQAVLGILAFVAIKNDDSELSDEVSKHLKKLYDKYWSGNRDDADLINVLQRNLECCGLIGPTDPVVQNGTELVNSCCSKDVISCTLPNAYKQGCDSALTDFLQNSIKTIGIIAVVFAIVEIVGAIFAFYVRNTIKRKGEYV